MKNITVSVDDETYRRARMKAAEQDTSVSALVKAFLVALAEDESDAERLRREERGLRAQIRVFRAADRLPPDQTHARLGEAPGSEERRSEARGSEARRSEAPGSEARRSEERRSEERRSEERRSEARGGESRHGET